MSQLLTSRFLYLVCHILFHRYSLWISDLNYLLDHISELCLISGRKLYVVVRLFCTYGILLLLVPKTVYTRIS